MTTFSLWTRIRRFSTCVMLMASLAFAFHNAAIAADFGLDDCSAHAGDTAQVDGHADGPRHGTLLIAHAADVDGGHSAGENTGSGSLAGQISHDADQHAHKLSCCGSACTVAVLATVFFLDPVRRAAVAAALPPLPVLAATEPHGLKRPPRLPVLG